MIIKIKNYFDNKLIKNPIISALLAGSILKFSFNKFSIFLCVILSFNILITLLNNCLSNKNLKLAFLIGYWFGFTYFFFTLTWITNSFTYVGLNTLYGYLALLALVTGFSLYSALSCFITVRLSTNKFNLNIYFAIFWTLSEYLRSTLFTGFPWNLIGYTTYKFTYFIQIADILGIFGLSFILLLIITLLRNRKQYIYGISLLLVTLSYGIYRIEIFNDYVIPENTHNIVVVHPSINQFDKMNNECFWNNIDLQVDLSHTNNTNNKKTLVIWPEAAINELINEFIVKYLSSTVTNNNTLLLTGIDRLENNNIYNSAIVINNKNEVLQYYDKKHLVPFGEYIPNWISSIGLSKIASGAGGFSSGQLTNTIKIDRYSPFDICICYEIIFPGRVMDSPTSSEWILNITNDAWFANSDEQYQHMIITCFRAIEQGRSIVRCNNNGISAIINCHGQIINFLNENTVGNICEEMPQKYYNTIYSKYNNKIILIILGLLLIIMLYNTHIKLFSS